MSVENEIAIEVSDFYDIIRTESGRKVMLMILEEAGYFDDTYSLDVEQLKYNTSKRSLGVWLYDKLNQASSDYLISMIKEHNENA